MTTFSSRTSILNDVDALHFDADSTARAVDSAMRSPRWVLGAASRPQSRVHLFSDKTSNKWALRRVTYALLNSRLEISSFHLKFTHISKAHKSLGLRSGLSG